MLSRYRMSWPGTAIAIVLLIAIVVVSLYVEGERAYLVLSALLGLLVGGAVIPTAVRRDEREHKPRRPPSRGNWPPVATLAVVLAATPVLASSCTSSGAVDGAKIRSVACAGARAVSTLMCGDGAPLESLLTSGGESSEGVSREPE